MFPRTGSRAAWLPLLLAGVLFPPGALAQEPQLAPKPAVLQRLQRLQPNQAVLLGQAKVVGEFNDVARRYRLHKTGPRARDYCLKMVWAPERKRALYCGANHGVPHRLNDVWEFDLAAMAWVLLYAPDNPRGYRGLGKDPSDVVFRQGRLMTRRGGPVVVGHTWWGLTYDTRGRQLLWMNLWATDRAAGAAQVGGDPSKLYAGPLLWAFSPQTRCWKPLNAPPPYPRAGFAGMLEYVPELQGAIWHTNAWFHRGTWLYLPEQNRWRNLKANEETGDFQAQAVRPEQVAYYDPGRKILVAHCQFDTHHFDLEKKQWRKVLSGQEGQVPQGHDARSVFYYDPNSGHGLLFHFRTNQLWSYDPDAVRWTRLAPQGDPVPQGKKRLAYFDPARGVFVLIRDTTVWAYRYR